MKRSTAVFAGAALAMSTVIGLTGASVAYGATPSDCGARLQVLADAEAEFNSAVAAGETRAVDLGIGGGVIAFAKAELRDGLTAAEKAGLMIHLPAVIAAGGGGEADLKLALRIEAAANALNRAQDRAEDCPRPGQDTDLNCNDFPLPDGRSAQDVLNETPGEDPHGLDANGNRIPCEVPDTDDEDEDDVVPDTSNGVATGLA